MKKELISKETRKKLTAVFVPIAVLLLCAFVYICISYTVIGSNTPRSLGNLTRTDVETLDLSGCKLDDLKGIIRCRSLRELSIADSSIADRSGLRELQSLRELDIRGCGIEPQEYDQLCKSLPECRIEWDVPISGERYALDTETIDLSKVDDSDFLMLSYLPELDYVDALGRELTFEQYNTLRSAVDSGCEIAWNVPLSEKSFRWDIRSIDLSLISEEDYQKLDCFPYLEKADAAGCAIDKALLDAREALPDCDFIWKITVQGESFDSHTEILDLTGKRKLTVDELTDAIDKLPELKRVRVCETKLTTDDIEPLMAHYPDIRFVWTLHLGPWDLDTDVTNFSTAHLFSVGGYMENDVAQQLKYCVDMVALDLGHNPIYDISFLRSMPKLRSLILVDNGISDLSPMTSLKNLEYVELFENKLVDISPLAECTNIKEINLCKNTIKDASPLYGLKNLHKVWIGQNGMTDEQYDEIKSHMPEGCIYIGKRMHEHPCSEGWRPLDYRLWGFRYEHPQNAGMYITMQDNAYAAAHDNAEDTSANIDPDAYGDEE